MIKKSIKFFIIVVGLIWGGDAFSHPKKVTVNSPDGKIEVTLLGENGAVSYSVRLNGEAIISASFLGLKSDPADLLEIDTVSRWSVDDTWNAVWGAQKTNHDYYHEAQLKVAGPSEQTIFFRVYNDGIAFRYQRPLSRAFSEKAYAYHKYTSSFQPLT